MVAAHQQVGSNAPGTHIPSGSVGIAPSDNSIADDRTELADSDLEKGSPSESYNDSEPSNHQGIDVSYAKHEFEGLRRRYSEMSRTQSRHSQHSNKISRTFSRKSQQDVEEEAGSDENDESQFDVEGVLRDRKKEMDEEQMRPKNLGKSHNGATNDSRCV
jgi:hypothetical protein